MTQGSGATRPRRPPISSHWLARLGFVMSHQPGVSRAWRLDVGDDYLLVTDVGGYDVPEPGAPASAYAFTRSDDLLEFEEVLIDSRSLHGWVRSASRRCRRRSRQGGGASLTP
ncbi:MAG: hypothetical protein BGO49_19465 [Planctomycetales bacterium 71-10]|nr:MAG: hypothetical protein BGO49_19465 [Planctomycetales bacterium 71-10]